jgi:hypothetical protein
VRGRAGETSDDEAGAGSGTKSGMTEVVGVAELLDESPPS